MVGSLSVIIVDGGVVFPPSHLFFPLSPPTQHLLSHLPEFSLVVSPVLSTAAK